MSKQNQKPKSQEPEKEPEVSGDTSVWEKPNGSTIEINNRQGNIDYAKSLGWKLVK